MATLSFLRNLMSSELLGCRNASPNPPNMILLREHFRTLQTSEKPKKMCSKTKVFRTTTAEPKKNVKPKIQKYHTNKIVIRCLSNQNKTFPEINSLEIERRYSKKKK